MQFGKGRLEPRRRTPPQGSQASVVVKNQIKLKKSPGTYILLPRTHLQKDGIMGSWEEEEEQGGEGLFRGKKIKITTVDE